MPRLSPSLARSFACLLPLLVAAHAGAAPALPDRVILVGDSTMASTTGYGDALCARFTPETACHNLARGGRLVWLSPLPDRTARAARAVGFDVQRRESIDLGGFHAELQHCRKQRDGT